MARIFLTGPSGCIGAATVKVLQRRGVDEIFGFSRSANPESVPPGVHPINGDIANPVDLERALAEAKPTHIINLAAFQTPDCQAHPFKGMNINAGGPLQLVQLAAKLEGLERFVNASSTAVYGRRDVHPQDVITTEALLAPNSLYGYWKIFTEGATEAFHMETGVPSISIRLATCFGPGRDKGYTSAPTTALKAAALGVPYEMPYHGREHYHFVGDVAEGIAQCCLDPFDGLATVQLRGRTIAVAEFLAEIKRQRPEAEVGISEDAVDLPFICDLDSEEVLALFPNMPLTNLADGISESLTEFDRQVAAAELTRL